MADDWKTDWTPGEWSVMEPDASGFVQIVAFDCDADDAGRAVVSSDEIATLADTQYEDANALLIAASPTMADVLADAPVLSRYHGHDGFEVERFLSDYDAWMARRRAALSLATGKEG